MRLSRGRGDVSFIFYRFWTGVAALSFAMMREINRQQLSRALRASFAIGLAGVLIAGCSPPGMRLLHMEVYQNDQLVLRTFFDAPDSEGPADFWRQAGAEPFASEAQVARVQVVKASP